MAMMTRSEVEIHSTRKSCWIIIKDNVYDITEFIEKHPGGANILLTYAGRDATKAFEPFHGPEVIQQYLSADRHLGQVPSEPVSSALNENTLMVVNDAPKLSSIISLSDFEYAASKKIPESSFAFLKSGAEDEHASNWNRDSWKAIRFRPRVLRPIETIDISCSILGSNFSSPFFICPAGGAKLLNSKGDICLTEAARRHGILHWACNNAAVSQQDMANARAPEQTLYWQIYAMANLQITEQQIKQAEKLGYKGFALTVDAIRPGKRERDVRLGSSEPGGSFAEDDEFAKEPSVKRPPVWSSFDWTSAIQWLRGITDLPIAIKGIQCWEDAELCMRHGVNPWLSNHGGRQLDGAPSSAETLISIRKYCPKVLEKCEVIVDGGVTRGSDIVKALSLGAKAVGVGRPFLYSLVFGEAGTSKAIRILKHEMETTMALLGVTSLDQLNPSYSDVC
ncbi:FMN-dependent dehydrogenase [Penicillium longicatenatum]|uniref:FMN-dependent dehydrogenase n=1 Tax=Penicillium longicatenatum TaxID=1561947 RepID=UPI002547BFB1|nr:FMN-dependent dehydrogenase [Penicillium longicatenatum]KAJ5635893.1 FMN-dependent dehydrogenase [Penicillium longicatenatum]